MANPTTNFGWVMPTSSSLVTNLPADFNTFGQAVDTSMSELLGGTTGQVLSKTSATDMAFTWVTPTDQTPLTTKGDLFTFTTVDARLGVGTDGQTLVADSSTATGLKWATPASGSTLVGCAVYSATSQTIADSTWTTALYGSEFWDTDGFHSTSTNTGRITIPTGKGGKYLVNIFGVWQAGSTGGRQLSILKNGTDEPVRNYAFNNSTTLSIQMSFQLALVAGDYIEVRVIQSNGGNLSWYGQNDAAGSLFAVTYLGA